jgi:hypothetical protein
MSLDMLKTQRALGEKKYRLANKSPIYIQVLEIALIPHPGI